ncbi:MAG: SWIM zinc finger family protein [Novosphingobium sp.]
MTATEPSSRATSPRFDPAAIRQLADAASSTCFARGESYYQSGQVELTSVTAERVVAQAFGNADYGVRITGQGDHIAGMCTCPAYDDMRFCKHMVAVMLAVNGASAVEQEPDKVGAAIGAHLESLSHAELLAYIIDIAETEPVLFRRLAEGAGADIAVDSG